MKNEKLVCERCKAEVLLNTDTLIEICRLGWVYVGIYLNDSDDITLCPHCLHELKRFLGGWKIISSD